jgi:uncharacterized protein (DUF924 family)
VDWVRSYLCWSAHKKQRRRKLRDSMARPNLAAAVSAFFIQLPGNFCRGSRAFQSLGIANRKAGTCLAETRRIVIAGSCS